MAARLLYRAQRRTQPFRDVSGDGRDQTGGGFVSFDPNIRADLWHDEVELRQCLERALACADVVKISVEELAFLTGNAQVHEGLAALMRTCPARLVLVTQGKEGVTAWQEGALTHYAASPVECIDTTGAGMLSSQGYCSVWHVMARPVSQRSSRCRSAVGRWRQPQKGQ